MGLRVSFELDDKDLKHFRLIMREARNAAVRQTPEDIVAAAENLLQSISETGAPTFIFERLMNLRRMINMLTDTEWRLPHQEAKRVLNALAYFAEPEDLIPDHIPGLGFLDDAIMIELVTRELRHEIDSYSDFCGYRDSRHAERAIRTGVSRDRALENRRTELQSRMRRRRKALELSGNNSTPHLFRR